MRANSGSARPWRPFGSGRDPGSACPPAYAVADQPPVFFTFNFLVLQSSSHSVHLPRVRLLPSEKERPCNRRSVCTRTSRLTGSHLRAARSPVSDFEDFISRITCKIPFASYRSGPVPDIDVPVQYLPCHLFPVNAHLPDAGPVYSASGDCPAPALAVA